MLEISEQELAAREQEYLQYLRMEGRLALSAKNLHLRSCQRCGHCCLGVTCVPKPEEIAPIAGFLGLSTGELIQRYMLVDRFDDSGYFLRFANEKQQDITGTCLPRERWFDRGYCLLYDQQNRACRVHPVRPAEARDWNCWEVKPAYLKAANLWQPADIYRLLPHFRPSQKKYQDTEVLHDHAL